MESKNNTSLMAQLLRELRTQMNGAVTGAMESRGIVYPLNYGVSLPTIRDIASEIGGVNSKLARLLYQQQVRELILAALVVVDPNDVTVDESEFWAKGIVNIEVAEQMAIMLYKSPACMNIALGWIGSGSKLLIYSALLSVRLAIVEGCRFDVLQLMDGVKCLESRREQVIMRGLEIFYVAIANSSAANKELVVGVCNGFKQGTSQCLKNLAEEIEWQI